MSVGVVVGTFGDEEYWGPLAQRALKSVVTQTFPVDGMVHVHAADLATARNEGAAQLETDWLIFLDADDTLHHDYVHYSMLGTGDIRQPMTVTRGNPDEQPIFIPPKNSLREGNWIVVGAMCKSELFFTAGGFNPAYPVYEDWALWLRMNLLGAEIGQAPGAIYEVTVREGSRNNVNRDTAVYWFRKIQTEEGT